MFLCRGCVISSIYSTGMSGHRLSLGDVWSLATSSYSQQLVSDYVDYNVFGFCLLTRKGESVNDRWANRGVWNKNKMILHRKNKL